MCWTGFRFLRSQRSQDGEGVATNGRSLLSSNICTTNATACSGGQVIENYHPQRQKKETLKNIKKKLQRQQSGTQERPTSIVACRYFYEEVETPGDPGRRVVFGFRYEHIEVEQAALLLSRQQPPPLQESVSLLCPPVRVMNVLNPSSFRDKLLSFSGWLWDPSNESEESFATYRSSTILNNNGSSNSSSTAAVTDRILSTVTSLFSRNTSNNRSFNTSGGDVANQQQQHPDSDIYDMCLEMNWDAAFQKCRECPFDATFQEGDNMETPLYMACQNKPPLSIVKALLQAYPQAAITKSRTNADLPLHIACFYNASIDVLRILVQDFPHTASQPSKWGCTPIVALWDGRTSQEGFIPPTWIQRLGSSNNHSSPTTTVDQITTNATTSTESNSVPVESHYLYNTLFWQKMLVLLQAVARHRQELQGHTTNYLYIVHAAVSLGSLGCPKEVLNFALQKYPEQVSMRDGAGRLPLHIVVAGPSLWDWDCQNSNPSNNTPRMKKNTMARFRMKPRELYSIAKLLQLYPQAAGKEDPNLPPGTFPLHTALAQNHQWHGGVQTLFQCAPEAIQQKDPTERVYPFLMNGIDLNTRFQLLLMHPAALQDARNIYIAEGRN